MSARKTYRLSFNAQAPRGVGEDDVLARTLSAVQARTSVASFTYRALGYSGVTTFYVSFAAGDDDDAAATARDAVAEAGALGVAVDAVRLRVTPLNRDVPV